MKNKLHALQRDAGDVYRLHVQPVIDRVVAAVVAAVRAILLDEARAILAALTALFMPAGESIEA